MYARKHPEAMVAPRRRRQSFDSLIDCSIVRVNNNAYNMNSSYETIRYHRDKKRMRTTTTTTIVDCSTISSTKSRTTLPSRSNVCDRTSLQLSTKSKTLRSNSNKTTVSSTNDSVCRSRWHNDPQVHFNNRRKKDREYYSTSTTSSFKFRVALSLYNRKAQ